MAKQTLLHDGDIQSHQKKHGRGAITICYLKTELRKLLIMLKFIYLLNDAFSGKVTYICISFSETK
jgi:hypothetical protein